MRNDDGRCIWWWVHCAVCGAETKAEPSTEEMATAWNARHDKAVEEMKNGKVCATCKWRSDEFTSVCVNDASDHLADFVTGDMTCTEWEGV